MQAAGRLFRRQGYAATGVDAVMASANLTAGAFYSHFGSKQDLLAEVLDAVFRDAEKNRPRELDTQPERAWLRAFVSFYLSRQHRDAAERGCPIPALGAEVARIGGKPQAVFERRLQGLVDCVAQQFDQARPDRERAISTMALCVGGMMLARAVSDDSLSEEILQACRQAAIEEVVSARRD